MVAADNYYLKHYGTGDAPPTGDVPAPDAAPDTEAQTAKDRKFANNYYYNRYGDPEVTLPKPPKPDRDYGWGITTAFKRGFERLRALPDVAQGDYEELAQHFRNLDEHELSDKDKQRMAELQDTEGWWDAAAYYFKNPALIGQIVAESLPMSAAPLAGGVAGAFGGGAAGTAVAGPAGGAAGAIGGTVLGGAAGSYATEYLNAITEHFSENGVDVRDPDQLRSAFANSELMTAARDYAHDRGIPIAIFDGLSFGLAGRIYRPVKGLVKGATGTAAGATAELSLQAGAGMAGEAGAQLNTEGEITDRPGVLAEGFGELVPGVIEAGANRFLQKEASHQQDDSLTRQLREDVPDSELDDIAAGADSDAIAFDTPKADMLSYQAAGAAASREKIQTRQYAALAQQRREQDDAQALAGASVEQTIREDERRSEAFLRAEAARDAAIERQRREAEYQRELQQGEAAAQIAPYEAPGSAPASTYAPASTAPTGTGTSLGELLKQSQAELETREADRFASEGVPVDPEPLVEPVPPTPPKNTREPNPARDTFLMMRAKMPATKRLSMDAFAAEGLDPADMRTPLYRGRPGFSKHRDAMTPDDVAEYLNEKEFPNPYDNGSIGTWDSNSALNAVTEEVQGTGTIRSAEGLDVAAAEKDYADQFELYQKAKEKRDTLGPPKIWNVEVDGAQWTVTEEPDGSSVEIASKDNPEQTTSTTRNKGETNADLIRAVMKAHGEETATKPVEEKAPSKEVDADRFKAKSGKGDLLGQDTTTAQGVADATTALDKRRNSGQDDVETGDPTDLFSKARNQVDIEDAASAKETPARKETEAEKEAREEREALQTENEPVEEDDDSDIPGFGDLDAAANEAATSPANDLDEPSDAQKKAGNYKKGHITLKGLPISIENPVGSERRGNKMKDHYGYIRRSEGADGEHVDVFVNPGIQTDRDTDVYVIDQAQEDGVTFDEHKVMLGYPTQLAAVRGYKRNYEKGWKVGPVTKMSMSEFKAWLESGTKSPAQKKPSRTGRKFVRTQKGLRYSLPKARKALLDDARDSVPGVDADWVSAVVGEPSETIDELVQQMAEAETQSQGKSAGMSVQAVKDAIAPIAKGNALLKGAEVYESVQAMPESKLKKSLLNNFGHSKPPAIYHIGSDRIVLFANRIKSPEAAVEKLLHEGVAHRGLRVLFSKMLPSGTVVVDIDTMNTMLDDVYARAKDRAALKRLGEKYADAEKGAQTTADRRLVAEEYIAEIAESGAEKSLIKRVISAIRKQLRDLGWVKDWTDADIRNLLGQVNKASQKGKSLDDVKVDDGGAGTVLRQLEKRIKIVEKLKNCL